MSSKKSRFCLDGRNHVADLQYSITVDESSSLNYQIISRVICSGEIEERFANAFRDVKASVDDLNRHAERAQKAIRGTFLFKLDAAVERF